MQTTPQSNRLTVSIFGDSNSGKSSLFNAILGFNSSIVSSILGTTTDPVVKSMELIPFGPITLIDTAGLNDKTSLGQLREKRSKQVLNRTDYSLYTIDVNNFDKYEYKNFKALLEEKNIPYLIVFTKKDETNISDINYLVENMDISNYCIVSINDIETIHNLKLKMIDTLTSLNNDNENLMGGILSEGSNVIMVVPIDSEAPKGRLILPQVQTIRSCLDNGLTCVVTTENQLNLVLEQNKKVNLVITDSQVFKEVDSILPKETPLTSFSILMARQKGHLNVLINGISTIKNLKDEDKILISEVCVHNRTHEDIGHVKIPNLLKKITGKELIFDFVSGRDFDNLEKYSLIVHCGGCMITRKEMLSRIQIPLEQGIPITNYGTLLAYGAGILDRSIEIFQ